MVGGHASHGGSWRWLVPTLLGGGNWRCLMPAWVAISVGCDWHPRLWPWPLDEVGVRVCVSVAVGCVWCPRVLR